MCIQHIATRHKPSTQTRKKLLSLQITLQKWKDHGLWTTSRQSKSQCPRKSPPTSKENSNKGKNSSTRCSMAYLSRSSKMSTIRSIWHCFSIIIRRVLTNTSHNTLTLALRILETQMQTLTLSRTTLETKIQIQTPSRTTLETKIQIQIPSRTTLETKIPTLEAKIQTPTLSRPPMSYQLQTPAFSRTPLMAHLKILCSQPMMAQFQVPTVRKLIFFLGLNVVITLLKTSSQRLFFSSLQ